MLFNSFYTLRTFQETGDTLIANIHLNADHPIYDGHFPGNPVTPGVVEMEIVKELLEQHYKQKLTLKSMSNAKFLAILNPEKNSTVKVQLTVSNEGNQIKCTATIAAEDTSFFKLQGIYQFTD